MATSPHSAQTPQDGIHVQLRWVVVSDIARNALAVSAPDVGGVCLQTDGPWLYDLVQVSPSVVWQRRPTNAEIALLAQIASKAPQAELDALETVVAGVGSSIAGKADAAELTAGLALKADAAALTAGLALKADTAELTAGLALKADAAALTAGLALKADAAALTSGLALKADATALALKADADDVDAALALKADATALALKANTADVTASLALKANTADVNAALGLKANIDTPVALADAPTIALNAALGATFRVTLGGNRALAAPTNPTDGQSVTLEIAQDGVGGRTLTLASGAGGFVFGTDGPLAAWQLSSAPNLVDVATFKYRASSQRWLVLGLMRGF